MPRRGGTHLGAGRQHRSIYGIGFPAWTGGVLQYVNQYEGGLAGFVERANELAATYGERFTPPASLVERAKTGETYE